MTTLMTSSDIRKILLNPIEINGVSQSNISSYCRIAPPSDGTSWWENGYVRHWTNVIIIPSFGIRLMQKKSPSILTPATGSIIFKISGLLELYVKVNGWQVGFNALICIDKASKLVKLISNNTSCAKNISAWQYQTIHNVLRTLVHANLNTIHICAKNTSAY